MPKLPEKVINAWFTRKGPVIFTTVDGNGMPNAIYATCVNRWSEDRIMIADNYFDKTRKNILQGSKGSILFMTEANKAYQLKGTIEYHKEGDIFQNMKKWNPSQHPGYAAAVLVIEEVYSGAEKLF